MFDATDSGEQPMNNILQMILERAEHRHKTGEKGSGFLLTLAQQVTDDLRLRGLTIWSRSADTFHVIASTETTPVARPDTEAPIDPAIGGVTNVRHSSPDNQAAQLLQTTASVAGNVQLILRAEEADVPVDHDVLLQLTDIFADLHRRNMLDDLVTRSGSEEAWQKLITQLHSSLDSRTIANTIATDVESLLPASRIAVGRRRGRRWSIVATTGVSQPNDRSDAVRQLVSAIQSASSGSIESATDGQHCLVHPLASDADWSTAEWAVVIESDKAIPDDTQTQRFLRHASLALANSVANEGTSAGSFLRTVTQPRGLSIILTGCLLAAALMLFQTELRIESYGELVPTQRNFVFAPDDGTITKLHVVDGSSVAESDIMCVLTNEELNVQQEAIAGEIAAANARLTAIDALRTGSRTDAGESYLLSAEQAELDERVRSLEKQWMIVTERLQLLQITSRSHGQVYGDRLRQMLYQRPVSRGQFLFEVADPSAGWQLKLRVPEADIRYVLAAQQESDQRPNITFTLETSPEVVRETSLVSLAASTEVDHNGELSTLAIADLPNVELDAERPGAGVVARIHCGKRSLGFVWFRQVIEFVQRHTWL